MLSFSFNRNHNFGREGTATGMSSFPYSKQSIVCAAERTSLIGKGCQAALVQLDSAPLILFLLGCFPSVTDDTIVLAPRKCCLDIIGLPRTWWAGRKDTHDRAMETQQDWPGCGMEAILAKYGMLRSLQCILDFRKQICGFLVVFFCLFFEEK